MPRRNSGGGPASMRARRRVPIMTQPGTDLSHGGISDSDLLADHQCSGCRCPGGRAPSWRTRTRRRRIKATEGSEGRAPAAGRRPAPALSRRPRRNLRPPWPAATTVRGTRPGHRPAVTGTALPLCHCQRRPAARRAVTVSVTRDRASGPGRRGRGSCQSQCRPGLDSSESGTRRRLANLPPGSAAALAACCCRRRRGRARPGPHWQCTVTAALPGAGCPALRLPRRRAFRHWLSVGPSPGGPGPGFNDSAGGSGAESPQAGGRCSAPGPILLNCGRRGPGLPQCRGLRVAGSPMPPLARAAAAAAAAANVTQCQHGHGDWQARRPGGPTGPTAPGPAASFCQSQSDAGGSAAHSESLH